MTNNYRICEMDKTDEKIVSIANQLAVKCLEHGIVLAAAESCTGGWLAKVVTDIVGSSAWFDCSFVTYSNSAKQSMISVQEKTLKAHGAVSEAVVSEMVEGVLQHSNATLAVAISGIAGPDGGTANKPVGLVWFAFSRIKNDKTTVVSTKKQMFNGDRKAVRAQAVLQALIGLINIIDSDSVV